VKHGKTAAARRVVPLIPKVRAALGAGWNGEGRPRWLSVPAPSTSGTLTIFSLKKQHARRFAQ
jgi:hypothetical protein